VTVQAMVYGHRDDHSGTGVAFSRNPNTGEPVPFGDVLFGGGHRTPHRSALRAPRQRRIGRIY
jgi:hypothetical protein